MIAGVTAFLSGHLAAGGLFMTAALALSSALPLGFLRFCTLSVSGAAAFAAVVDGGSTRWVWLALAIISGLWHVALRKGRGTWPWVALVVALTSAGVPVMFAVLASDGARGLVIAGALSSSLLLGAVTVTMILGHWYLVDTSLSIAPLRNGALWFSIAVVLRWVAVLVVLGYGGWEVLRVGRAADLIFSTNGLFFLFRSLMGLAAPLLLAGLIWQTVKMRSTQSATGLLYVALILVLFGELVSQFLFVMTGYPL